MKLIQNPKVLIKQYETIKFKWNIFNIFEALMKHFENLRFTWNISKSLRFKKTFTKKKKKKSYSFVWINRELAHHQYKWACSVGFVGCLLPCYYHPSDKHLWSFGLDRDACIFGVFLFFFLRGIYNIFAINFKWQVIISCYWWKKKISVMNLN